MQDWYRKRVELVVEELETDLERGLTGERAAERLQILGPNKLQEGKGRTPLEMFIDQFKDALVIILLISAVISGFLGEVGDAVVITIILVLNSTLGVIQEYKAEKSLEALKDLTAPEAVVLRGGRQQKVAASSLVPGDIILLEAGDYVPADMRITAETDLQTEESVLTGESVPVNKTAAVIDKETAPLGDRKNIAFMGTIVTYGRARGIVTATGMKTEMGQIAEMLGSSRREPTPLQKRLDQMGKKLGLLTLLIVAVVIIAGLLRGMGFMEMFMTGISLAVAAVPEGLPAVVTIVLALGVQRMIKKHAIIRRLPAVETLGATTVICSDKTGTLTQNQMTVKALYLPGRRITVSGEGYEPAGAFFLSDGSGENLEYEQDMDQSLDMDNEQDMDHSLDKNNERDMDYSLDMENGSQQIAVDDDPDLSLLLKGAALCNNAELVREEGPEKVEKWAIIGDPTEGALVAAAAKGGYEKAGLEAEYRRIKEFPFDSNRKMMSTVNQLEDGRRMAFIKGAPDIVIKLSSHYQTAGEVFELKEELRNKILGKNEEFAREALRVLAVACKPLPGENRKDSGERGEYQREEVEQDLIFLGLLGMIDPPRREVAASVQTCRQAGIKPVMITGDYPVTAKVIAEELGIYREGDKLLTGSRLEELGQEELEEVVLKTTVFARVSPKHKSRIIKALQKNKQIVAMTGDGVNDAPALKDSNIGVAMGITGTDVSKEAADMVLTDDNFASIVAAVEEGRNIYQNIKKFIRFLLACNVGEILAIFLAIIGGLPRPLFPIQILWVNLVTDGLPALALGVDPSAGDLMQHPPRDPEEGILAGRMGFNILSQGSFIGLITLLAFYLGLREYSLPAARTMAFGTLSLAQLFQAVNSRSERHSLFKIGFFRNRYLLLAIGISGALQLGVMLIPFLQPLFQVVPLSIGQWLFIIALAAFPLPYVELLKFLGLTYKK